MAVAELYLLGEHPLSPDVPLTLAEDPIESGVRQPLGDDDLPADVDDGGDVILSSLPEWFSRVSAEETGVLLLMQQPDEPQEPPRDPPLEEVSLDSHHLLMDGCCYQQEVPRVAEVVSVAQIGLRLSDPGQPALECAASELWWCAC